VNYYNCLYSNTQISQNCKLLSGTPISRHLYNAPVHLPFFQSGWLLGSILNVLQPHSWCSRFAPRSFKKARFGSWTRFHQMADICSCCNLSKTTYETPYWAGSLQSLRIAAQSGCIRCTFLAKCLASFVSNVFGAGDTFVFWGNFSRCHLTLWRDEMAHIFFVDIFSLPG
jgi:hypothetical protein